MQRHGDGFQLGIVSDDLRRAAPLSELLFQQDVLGGQPALHQRPLHHEQQNIGIDRLRKKVEGAFFHRRHRVLNTAVCGHDNHGQLGLEILGRAQHT